MAMTLRCHHSARAYAASGVAMSAQMRDRIGMSVPPSVYLGGKARIHFRIRAVLIHFFCVL